MLCYPKTFAAAAAIAVAILVTTTITSGNPIITTASSNSVAHIHNEWQHKASHDPCWRQAFLELETSCRAVQADKQLRAKLARKFMVCQLEMDGRHDDAESVKESSGSNNNNKIDNRLYSIYVGFSHHVDIVCFHLQQELIDAARRETLEKLHHGSEAAAGQLTRLSQSSRQLHEQFLLSQQEAAESSHVVANALKKVTDVSDSLKNSVDQQLVGTELVASKMQQLAEENIHLEKSHAALRRAISMLSSDVEGAQNKVAGSLTTLYNAQRRTIGFIGSLDAFIFYAVFVAGILLVTSLAAAAPARLPALVAGPLCSLLTERYCLYGCLRMLAAIGLSVDPTSVVLAQSGATVDATSALLDPAPLRNLFVLVAAVAVIVCMWRYESPELQQQRQMQRMLESALLTASSPTKQRGGAAAASPPRLVDREERLVIDDDENDDAPSPTKTEVAAAAPPASPRKEDEADEGVSPATKGKGGRRAKSSKKRR